MGGGGYFSCLERSAVGERPELAWDTRSFLPAKVYIVESIYIANPLVSPGYVDALLVLVTGS